MNNCPNFNTGATETHISSSCSRRTAKAFTDAVPAKKQSILTALSARQNSQANNVMRSQHKWQIQ